MPSSGSSARAISTRRLASATRVLLLLARLGLRSDDVAALRMCNRDWGRGRISVRGKSHRESWFPLHQAAGDFILAYLERARPPIYGEHVFTRMLAPIAPLPATAISKIVDRAMARAGVKSRSRGGTRSPAHSWPIARPRLGSGASSRAERSADRGNSGAITRHDQIFTQKVTVSYSLNRDVYLNGRGVRGSRLPFPNRSIGAPVTCPTGWPSSTSMGP